MYKVNGQEIKSFSEAVKQAEELNTTVIEVETGLTRWRPALKPTVKKVRQYEEQKAAYAAQQSLK